jgi:hypothetical protein
MRFSLTTVIAIVPLLASATPLAQPLHVTIPISKKTDLRRDDGSVDIEALKASVSASTTYIIPFLDRSSWDLTYFIVSSFAVSILVNVTLSNPTTINAPLVRRLLPKPKIITGMVKG